MSAIRLLIVDDHEVVRVGLRAILETEDDISVVGEAGDGEHAVQMVRSLRPDVVILDVRLGLMDGIAACREIVDNTPGTAVLILTSFGTVEAVMAALVAGASGFLLKNSDRSESVQAADIPLEDFRQWQASGRGCGRGARHHGVDHQAQ